MLNLIVVILNLSAFIYSSLPPHTGGEAGWIEAIKEDKAGITSLLASHRCVSANDLMNTSLPD